MIIFSIIAIGVISIAIIYKFDLNITIFEKKNKK
jgi:hypothetical protein